MNGMNALRSLARLALVVSASTLAACAGDYGSSGSTGTATGQPTSLRAPVSGSLVTRAQTLLGELGFEPGPVDGQEGPQTASAVRAYQGAAGLRKDGRVSISLVDHLSAAVERRQVVRAQSQLAALGYDPGPVDGHAGPLTRSAVEAFQGAEGLSQDGRVSSELLAALETAGAKGSMAAEAPTAAEAETTAEASSETAEAVEQAAAETEAAATTSDATAQTAVETSTESATEEVATAAAAATAAGAAATQTAAVETASATETAAETASETVAEETAEKAEEVAALATDDQALKAGDRVQLSYLGAAEKPLELEIGQDGRLAVPDAGSVEAAGLGLEELRDKVTVTLIESYLDKIDIDVGLVQAAGGETAEAAAGKLAAGDQVLVNLAGAKSASSTLEVADDGSLEVPEAGSIQAAGLGLTELKEEIGVKLLESYMRDLNVNVEQVQ